MFLDLLGGKSFNYVLLEYIYIIKITFSKEQLPFFILLPKLQLNSMMTKAFSKFPNLGLKKKNKFS